MRDIAPRGEIAPAIAALVALEKQVAVNARSIDAELEPRVYEWRPSGVPELPAIWNWIAEDTYEVVDTARADDVLVIATSIGVKPSDLGETANRLVRLLDIFRRTVDPALDRKVTGTEPLDGTVRFAKRVLTRSEIDWFNDVPVMTMKVLIRLELNANLR